MRPELVRLSKFMALALRHRAPDFGLEPDAHGFVPLDDLVALVEKNERLRASRADILAVVEQSRPRRYELKGDLIRAAYGHSKQAAAVTYPPVAPPPALFHGTNPNALAGIQRVGLLAMRRQYVHLSTSLERAQEVGRRRARSAVILTVRALAAHAAGIEFYAPEPEHYLARAIPPEFIVFPDPA